jgi:hypothetical protein
MHSPEVLAFHIRRPWPQRSSFGSGKGRWRWRPPFVTVAGRPFYFPDLIAIWHIEPHGEDALQGECRGTHWHWHVHHWEIQWCFMQDFQQRYLTRCAWCGKGSTKRDRVNVSHDNHIGAKPPNPWWRGRANSVHGECSTVAHAHRICLCDNPGLSQGDYGQCVFCGKFRAWRREPTIPDRYLASLPAGSRIPHDKRDWLKAEWAKLRSEREAKSDLT